MTLAFPSSFRDPLYEQLARATETKLGLPRGILDAIRTRGERSNADQISSAGARGPYQFIPSTRQGFIKQYGIDPWSSADTQTEAAGLHIRDDHRRTGSWDEAIARYHGGQRPPPASYRYQARVGDFDNIDTSKPYYTGADEMPQSRYPVVNGVDPLAPERPAMPAPLPGPAPSTNVAAASPAASHKRGGILGALESVFMPDPGSRWAGALRDGMFNAKESQMNYLESQATKQLDLATANEKLKRLRTQGEFQIVGNNVFHIKPDGSHELITPPTTPTEHERLIDRWRTLDESDPAKKLIYQMLLGANNPDTVAARSAENEKIARIRAGATTGSATIRANAANRALPPLPPGFSVVK